MKENNNNEEFIIDWSKFKSNIKGGNLEKAKQGYIEFCKMLNEVDFELIGDYVGSMSKVELDYKLDNNLRLNIKPSVFKRQTYKTIINFKKELTQNRDVFVLFIKLTNSGNLIAKIKTFDGGEIEIDIATYSKWNKSRQDFYSKLREVGGSIDDYYVRKDTKMTIYIDDIKLNLKSASNFKTNTYKSIINFKNELKKNNDKFIKFIGLNSKGVLLVKIVTFDKGKVDIDVSQYRSFNKSRQGTYNYCASKGYKVLSPYVNATEKILIDFNCGHKPHWITPAMLKSNQGCPVCDESKGEKAIRTYLEKNNIEFIQEYRFDDCKYKYTLPFDFYIPKYNLCIEFDGIQHFEARDYFGKEIFEETRNRDKIKNKFCERNGISLLRIPYWELDNISKILDKKFDKLKDELKEVCL